MLRITPAHKNYMYQVEQKAAAHHNLIKTVEKFRPEVVFEFVMH
jgi:hypothetical protein